MKKNIGLLSIKTHFVTCRSTISTISAFSRNLDEFKISIYALFKLMCFSNCAALWITRANSMRKMTNEKIFFSR